MFEQAPWSINSKFNQSEQLCEKKDEFFLIFLIMIVRHSTNFQPPFGNLKIG